MRLGRFRDISIRIISLVLLLQLSLLARPLFPEVNKRNNEDVKVTVFVVPEKEACKPTGYESYEADGKINCPPLTPSDIEIWKQQGRICKTFTIPEGAKLPYELKLGEKLFEILDVYATRPKANADKRLSVVLFFEWEEPKIFEVSLERVVPNKIPIPSYRWSANLKNQRYWIHHERADAFLPANNIRWTLKAGNKVWEFVPKI